MGALAGALLFSLLLLSAGGDAPASTEGEWCGVWEGSSSYFWCPRGPDGADARFCCGTCSRPSCCASVEGRLDQSRCPHAGASGTAGPPPTTGQPPMRESDVWALRLFIVLLVIAFIFCMTFNYCKDKWFTQTRRHRTTDVATHAGLELTPLGSVPRPPPPSPLLVRESSVDDPPPPYPYEDLPPSYSEVFSQSSWDRPLPSSEVYLRHASSPNLEGESTNGSLVHRNVPSHVSDSAGEAESSV